jgi:hypothetical protein
VLTYVFDVCVPISGARRLAIVTRPGDVVCVDTDDNGGDTHAPVMLDAAPSGGRRVVAMAAGDARVSESVRERAVVCVT